MFGGFIGISLDTYLFLRAYLNEFKCFFELYFSDDKYFWMLFASSFSSYFTIKCRELSWHADHNDSSTIAERACTTFFLMSYCLFLTRVHLKCMRDQRKKNCRIWKQNWIGIVNQIKEGINGLYGALLTSFHNGIVNKWRKIMYWNSEPKTIYQGIDLISLMFLSKYSIL